MGEYALGPTFHRIVAVHRSHIRRIVFGRCHLTRADPVCGVPISGMRGILHQSRPDFSPDWPLCFAPAEALRTASAAG